MERKLGTKQKRVKLKSLMNITSMKSPSKQKEKEEAYLAEQKNNNYKLELNRLNREMEKELMENGYNYNIEVGTASRGCHTRTTNIDYF